MPITMERMLTLAKAARAINASHERLVQAVKFTATADMEPAAALLAILQHVVISQPPAKALAVVMKEEEYFTKNASRLKGAATSMRGVRHHRALAAQQQQQDDDWQQDNHLEQDQLDQGQQDQGQDNDRLLREMIAEVEPEPNGSIHDDLSGLDLGLGIGPRPVATALPAAPPDLTEAEVQALATSPLFRPPPHILSQMDSHLRRANGWFIPGDTEYTAMGPTDGPGAPHTDPHDTIPAPTIG